MTSKDKCDNLSDKHLSRSVNKLVQQEGKDELQCDRGLGAFQSFPEWKQGVRAFACLDKNDRAGVQIEDDCQIPMSFADGNLVNGDEFQVFQPGPGVAFREIPLLDILDYIPTDAKVLGSVFNGHMTRQPQRITFKRLGIRSSRIGNADFNLANNATGKALNARNMHRDIHLFVADGQCLKPADGSAASSEIPTITTRTTN